MHVTLYKLGKIPVPPRLYGGTERYIFWLGQALIALGHRVTLIANAESRLPGAELRTLAADEKNPQAWLNLIPDATDIVHFHEQPRGIVNKPYLLTVHGNGRRASNSRRTPSLSRGGTRQTTGHIISFIRESTRMIFGLRKSARTMPCFWPRHGGK